jgi:tricorn protease
MKRIATVALLVFCATAAYADPPQGYYRFPALSADKIIFTGEGDLWAVGLGGGAAERLTSHPGSEWSAAVSPDGKTVAFSAQYEGPTEVYTMPIDGGLPTRRTFDGENALVVGWTPDGKIMVQTSHFSTLPNRQLLTVDPKSGKTELLPLSQASDGCFDDSGRVLYFTRLPFQGSHTKRYKGGTAQTLWKYELGRQEAVPLTPDYPGTSKTPMWWKGRVYFASDRDGTMNLWSMGPDGKDLKQHSFLKGWDVKSPSLRGGRIVYQAGADIHVFDIAAGADRLVSITLTSDLDQERERWVKKPMDYLTSAHVAPDGARIALTARGQVFVAPAEQGRLVQATSKSSVRYRDARFMPDGKSLLVLSDESGELEFWRVPANGVGRPEQLTQGGTVFRYEGLPSPDGKWIAFDDKNQKLWLHNIGEKRLLQIASSELSGFSWLNWSPDSNWLAYVSPADNEFDRIWLYGLKDDKTTALTDDRVDSYNPVWSPDGRWIYFLSDRYFQSLVASPWGPRQPEPFFGKTTKICAASLRKDGRFPFAPDNELMPPEQKEKEQKNQAKAEEAKAEGVAKSGAAEKKIEVLIDFDGIASRISEVPVPAGRYRNLAIDDKCLFWSEADVSASPKARLVALEIKNKDISPKTLVEDIGGYEMSLDGKKLMVRKSDGIRIIDAAPKPPADLAKAKVNLDDWTFSISPREEWRQMFVEAWRLERDYFYDPNLHGIDYRGLLEKHLPLVARVTDRDELNDLISDLVGELAALHIFVAGGDRRVGADQINPASLGARLERDEAAGGYRIAHIYRSDPDYPEVSSPLSKPGLAVSEGDLITAINGVAALEAPSPSMLLRNKAGQQVLLGLKSSTSGHDYEAVVTPITINEEVNLRYAEWEYTRRLAVEEKGGGDIGYVHLRAMGGGDYTEWVKNFYPVFNRKGLIIDVRHNGGGNIDSWILEKLMRKAWFYWKNRLGRPTWNMQYAFRGHMVVLCNERTASDGEAFTEGFRRLGLGKVIGTRTWGGEIWLSFDTWLVDRGIASAAEMGVYGPEGQWLIEGHGVDPDIVVDNPPRETFDGRDAQLEAAVKYLKEEIRLHPVEVPPAPKYPVKAFDYLRR